MVANDGAVILKPFVGVAVIPARVPGAITVAHAVARSTAVRSGETRGLVERTGVASPAGLPEGKSPNFGSATGDVGRGHCGFSGVDKLGNIWCLFCRFAISSLVGGLLIVTSGYVVGCI